MPPVITLNIEIHEKNIIFRVNCILWHTVQWINFGARFYSISSSSGFHHSRYVPLPPREGPAMHHSGVKWIILHLIEIVKWDVAMMLYPYEAKPINYCSLVLFCRTQYSESIFVLRSSWITGCCMCTCMVYIKIMFILESSCACACLVFN